MKKILLSILFLITLINAKDVNTILINDGTKPKIDLMAEIMKMDEDIKSMKVKTKQMEAETEAQRKELASAVELGKTLDELRDTLLTKQKK